MPSGNDAPTPVFPVKPGSVLLTLFNVTCPFCVGVLINISVIEPLLIVVFVFVMVMVGVGFTVTTAVRVSVLVKPLALTSNSYVIVCMLFVPFTKLSVIIAGSSDKVDFHIVPTAVYPVTEPTSGLIVTLINSISASTVTLFTTMSVSSPEHMFGKLFVTVIFGAGLTITSAMTVVGFTQPFPLASNS